MDVELPNGQVIQDVPDGTTQAQLRAKLEANGIEYMPKQTDAQTLGQTVAGIVPSAYTGLVRGTAATTGLVPDAIAAIKPEWKDYLPTSEATLKALDPLLPTPRGRIQKDVAAGMSAVPTAAFSPGTAALGFLGGAAGQDMTNWAQFKDDPKTAEILGNIAIPAATAGLSSGAHIIKYFMHKAGLGGLSHAADILNLGKAAPVDMPAIDPETLIKMKAGGTYTQKFIDQLAENNIRKLNPGWPVEPEGQAAIWAKKLAEALLDFGARPYQQINANQTLGE